MLELIVIGLIVVLGIVGLALLVYIVATYNSLIVLRNRVNNAWAQIDVQLKRRYDLIPNLIETVKGYVKHERETFTEITKYRSQLMKGGVESKAAANNQLTNALKSLFAVAENYPKLQANENFKMLQEELAGTENKIAYIRTAYNDSVYQFNTKCDVFPSNIIANLFGFKHREFFQVAAEEQRKAVKVKF